MKINEQGQLVLDDGQIMQHDENAIERIPRTESEIKDEEKLIEKYGNTFFQEIPIQLNWVAAQMQTIAQGLFNSQNEEIEALIKRYSPRIIARAIAIISYEIRIQFLCSQYEKSDSLAKAIHRIFEDEANRNNLFGNIDEE